MKKLKIWLVLIPVVVIIVSALLFSQNKMFCALMIFGNALIIIAKAYVFYADHYSTDKEEKLDYHLLPMGACLTSIGDAFPISYWTTNSPFTKESFILAIYFGIFFVIENIIFNKWRRSAQK